MVESLGLKERVKEKLEQKANTFKEVILSPDIFCVTWEQIPGRGAFELQQAEIIDNAERAARGSRIHAMSVTDNPGGNPALSTEMLCAELKRLGMEPLVHLACRDKNRNEIESILYGLAAEGVRNILVLTGDFPSSDAFNGRPKPVFDLDPVHVLQLVKTVNNGLEHEVMGKKKTLAPTDFFAGASVSPFKQLESELMGQYYKLDKKIQAGAGFLITQVGYDARKFHELLQWLKMNKYNIPVLANIYVLSYGAARAMNANQIPGCVVTGKLLAELAEEAKAKDKGVSARLNRAAKMYAVAKGMGYAGAHIGGQGIRYDMVEYIIEKGEELSKNWRDLVPEFDYPQNNGFYFFQKDLESGLNLEKPALRVRRPSLQPMYGISKLAHALFFEPKNPVFKMLKPIATVIDSRPTLRRVFSSFEHLGKAALYGCMSCGDCALFDIAYLCPMSQCPKNQRNGPCGGSYMGWCEVYPNQKRCMWVKAYERLNGHNKAEEIGGYIVPPCNWELWRTSSWLNFYFGRDHATKIIKTKSAS
ncbi:MAG: methylenetetrahydrofolate reductase [Clostridia bacterium]|nr:MAG: methylenetetrahydrofolate reductase [Clostridia bacterium]